MGLPATGIVDSETWNQLYNSILGIFNLLSPENVYLPRLRYPGIELRRDMLQEQPGVFILQQMLSYIALVIPSIPPITVSGIFDEKTENAVMAFQTMFGLEPTGIVDEASWNEIARIYSEQRFNGLIAPQEII